MSIPNTPDDALPADVDAGLDSYLDQYVQARTVELQNLNTARDVLLDAVAYQVSEQLVDGSLRPDEVRDVVPDWALDAVLERLSPLDAHAIRTGAPPPDASPTHAGHTHASETHAGEASEVDISGAETGDANAWIEPAPWSPTWDHRADHTLDHSPDHSLDHSLDHGVDHRPGRSVGRGGDRRDDLDAGW